MIMKRSILLFLFLALAMTVMSAPAKKQGRAICSRANKASLLAKAKGKNTGGAQSSANKGGQATRSTAGGVAQAKGGAPAKAPAQKKSKRNFYPDSDDSELFRRASETSLCGISIRGSSSRMCQGNSGYFKDAQGRYGWTPWDGFKNLIKSSTVPSRYQCDHALELQLTAKALTDAGFCKAWTKMEKAWKKIDPRKDVKKAMKDAFVRGGSLKETANSLSMLFYVDTPFNEYKRAWVSAYLRGSPQATSSKLKGYFDPTTSATVDGVAAGIDSAATALLNTIVTLATPANFDWDTATQDEADGVCELDDALLSDFKEGYVNSYWQGMKGRVHG